MDSAVSALEGAVETADFQQRGSGWHSEGERGLLSRPHMCGKDKYFSQMFIHGRIAERVRQGF